MKSHIVKKQIDGKGTKVGNKDISDTTTRERTITGGITQDKNGNIDMKGKYEDSNTKTQKIENGKLEAEKSHKTFSSTEVNANVDTKNGQTSATVGISDSRGTQHSASAQISEHYKAEASAGKTQTLNVEATVTDNGLGVKGNSKTEYNAQGNVKMNNLNVGAQAKASENTFGGASAQMKDGKFDANANIGREYNAKAEVNINGNPVASAEASARGEAKANVGISNNKVSAKAEVNAEVGGKASIGQTEIKAGISVDFHAGVSIDKKGLHFDVGGGIHPEVHIIDKATGKDTKLLNSPGTPSYILYKKRKIRGKKKVKKTQKNRILGQICRPNKYRI